MSKASVDSKLKGDTTHLYDEVYFQGDRSKSNYSNYIENSRIPSIRLADTLFQMFQPKSFLDMGCAVGHTVKHMRTLGVDAHGMDISEWAVSIADVPYIKQFDFSKHKIESKYELVVCYDVVEHVVPDRLEFASSNLWSACEKHLLVVPATYENGETFDPNEPTHLIFQSRNWWLDYFEKRIGCTFNKIMTELLQDAEHSKVYNYSHRIMVFSK